MSYADLKKEASDRGLTATGTKVELIARLSTSEPVPTGETPEEPVETQPAKTVVTEQQVEKAWRSDIERTKAHLDAQPKVQIMIPLEQGVAPSVARQIPFEININGYKVSLIRGTQQIVPEQIAKMVWERLESEGSIGNEWRIDNNPARQEALG